MASPNQQEESGALHLAKSRMQELAERINRLKLALTLLCMHFPTDDDMQAAGWSTQEVSAACDAYDHARSVLNKEQKA